MLGLISLSSTEWAATVPLGSSMNLNVVALNGQVGADGNCAFGSAAIQTGSGSASQAATLNPLASSASATVSSSGTVTIVESGVPQQKVASGTTTISESWASSFTDSAHGTVSVNVSSNINSPPTNLNFGECGSTNINWSATEGNIVDSLYSYTFVADASGDLIVNSVVTSTSSSFLAADLEQGANATPRNAGSNLPVGTGQMTFQVTAGMTYTLFIVSFANSRGAGGSDDVSGTLTFSIPSGVGSGVPPTIDTIVNGATFQVEPLSPGTWFSVFGQNLGLAGAWGNSSSVVVGASTVSVCGSLAIVSFNSGPLQTAGGTVWQVNALMPDAAAGQTSCPVVVTANGIVSQPAIIQVSGGVMELFSFAPAPGLSLPLITHADYTLVGPTAEGLVPAYPGETVVAWGTGDCSDPATAVGGLPAIVVYAGRSSPGVCQFNFIIPASAVGSATLTLSSSPHTYTLAIAP